MTYSLSSIVAFIAERALTTAPLAMYFLSRTPSEENAATPLALLRIERVSYPCAKLIAISPMPILAVVGSLGAPFMTVELLLCFTYCPII